MWTLLEVLVQPQPFTCCTGSRGQGYVSVVICRKKHRLSLCPAGCWPEGPSVGTGLVSHPSVMLTGHKQNTQTLTSVWALLNTRRETPEQILPGWQRERYMEGRLLPILSSAAARQLLLFHQGGWIVFIWLKIRQVLTTSTKWGTEWMQNWKAGQPQADSVWFRTCETLSMTQPKVV